MPSLFTIRSILRDYHYRSIRILYNYLTNNTQVLRPRHCVYAKPGRSVKTVCNFAGARDLHDIPRTSQSKIRMNRKREGLSVIPMRLQSRLGQLREVVSSSSRVDPVNLWAEKSSLQRVLSCACECAIFLLFHSTGLFCISSSRRSPFA